MMNEAGNNNQKPVGKVRCSLRGHKIQNQHHVIAIGGKTCASVSVCVLLIAALALRFLPAELRRAIALRAVNLAAASSKSL